MTIGKKKTVVISGNANDMGLALALPYAKASANIFLIIDQKESWHHETFEKLKTIQPDIVLEHIPMADETKVQQVTTAVLKQFGGLDILVNNVGAELDIDTTHIHPQQFDLMHSLNVRNTFMLSKICYPFLKNAANPHIINISPPLDIDPQWFKNHLAFSMSTYSMSMCTLGMAAEFRKSGIAVNSIWPADKMQSTFAEAVFALSQKKAGAYSGNFCIY